jgi:hypothetical protein
VFARFCGAKFSATRNSEFCPMCMLRQALPDAVESVESPSEDTVTLTERFEHYELVKDEHGNPQVENLSRYIE